VLPWRFRDSERTAVLVGGGKPAPTETFGLQNVFDFEALSPDVIRLGTLQCFHEADGDAGYPSFAMYGADDGTVIVTRRLSNEVIGRFSTLNDAEAAFKPPGLIRAWFGSAAELYDDADEYLGNDFSVYDDWV
jgi:hypothetical protein